MTYRIGLTGGIGSGKTEVTRYFETLGVPVIDADKIAHELLSPGNPALTKVIQRFGTGLLQQNGELNRAALREIIFQNSEDKKWLEHLLHPLINQTISYRLGQVHDKYCIVVIPLLAEHFENYQHLLDHVIVIDVNEQLQVERATARDKSGGQLIRKIIHSQAERQKRLSIADTILTNNGSLEELKNKIKNLHTSIVKSIDS